MTAGEQSSGKRRALWACGLLLSGLALPPACTTRNPAFVASVADGKMDAALADVPQPPDSAGEVRTDDVKPDDLAPNPVDAITTDAVFDVHVDPIPDAHVDPIPDVHVDAIPDVLADAVPTLPADASVDAARDVASRVLTLDDRLTFSATNINRWNYAGPGWTWCDDACPGRETLYAGTNTWSRVAGAEATLNFQGTTIRLYGVLDPTHGIGVVSVDGANPKDVDFYAATRAGNQQVWSATVVGGPAETHQLKIQVTGRRRAASSDANVAIDRVEIE